MLSDPAALYNAYAARDPRFDGVFYVGVTSTGIYCRPICPAKTPKAANIRFFENAAAAEHAGFRPCLRCRPELAPGHAPVDNARQIAHLIVARLEEGSLAGTRGLEAIAQQFGWSARHIRRIVHQELGVAPIDLLLTRRLLLAKQLLTETNLSASNIALASGFSSLRRFNDAFQKRYRMPPTRLRKEVKQNTLSRHTEETFTLQLAYRPPFDWMGLLDFLRARTLKGVEWIDDHAYARTVQIGTHTGWVRIHNVPEHRTLSVEVAQTLAPVLPAVLARLRNLFDLAARPDVINERLASDPMLAQAVARNPGLRVPGAFDGFELALRAILGQQVTVKAATTLAGRVMETFGNPVATPYPQLTHTSPTALYMAAIDETMIATHGIVVTRARSIVAIARAIADGHISLESGAPSDEILPNLTALPGIGPWTAQYIAMRALRWPDAFPKEDLVLRKRLGNLSPAKADARSQAWRPWRSYATLHLWQTPH